MLGFILGLVTRSRHTAFSVFTCIALGVISVDAQTGEIPRTQDGKPDMNGIWQALGNAHWDIEQHTARALSLKHI